MTIEYSPEEQEAASERIAQRARMIDDLRAYRARTDHDVYPLGHEELDALLDVADRLRNLEREACQMADDVRATAARKRVIDATSTCYMCGENIVRIEGEWCHAREATRYWDHEPVPHRRPKIECRYCSTEIRMLGGTWLHVDLEAAYNNRGPHHPEPKL